MAFREFWRARFGGLPPASHILRKTPWRRWIRFHALPGSKRYAETPEEVESIFSRARALGDAALGWNAPCWAAVNRYVVDGVPCNETDDRLDRHGATKAWVWEEREAFGPPSIVETFVWETIWDADRLRDLLDEAARWNGMKPLLISRETAAVFAPYDGGFDIVMPDFLAAREIGWRFAGWLPDTPGGL